MFNKLFKQKNEEARDLYACALISTRKELFYSKYGVADSFDGRFDLLLLHIFIILRRAMGRDDYQKLSQAIFDIMFKDVDQTLRERGIGDVGIPKHMKKMMLAFNGRMHAYQDALESGDLKEAVARNLYAMDIDDKLLDKNALNAICEFTQINLNSYNNLGDFVILEGQKAI